uniref:Uncharacterized protein n=1 Tax=Solanum tuberosum TaxID=4113 RepID=M1DPX1_SOLTU
MGLVDLSLLCCNLRNLGKSRLGSPIPLSASPFGQLGHRVGPYFGEDTGNFGELNLGRRIHSAHRQTSTQIANLPFPIVKFGTMATGSETHPPKGKVTLETILEATMDVSRMMGRMHERLTAIEDGLSRMDETWSKEKEFTLPSYVAEAQGEGEKRKLKGKAKLLLDEHKEIREDVGVESALILKDHELQANPSHSSLLHSISFLLQDPREALVMDTFVAVPTFLRECHLTKLESDHLIINGV